MSEEQKFNALELLARLCAAKNGIDNPEINTKETKKAS